MDLSGISIDIPQLSMNMAQQKVSQEFGVAMLAKTMDVVQENGDALTKMMEQSVTPELGGSIDINV